MMLLKASAQTYDRVVRHRVHAFRNKPKHMEEGQTVLLSKNRSGSAWYERQVQHVARVRRIRPATAAELDRLYPGVNAGERWNYLVELYAVTPLRRLLDLHQVPGIDANRFHTVQHFAYFDPKEDSALLSYLGKREAQVVCDLLNADPKAEAQPSG